MPELIWDGKYDEARRRVTPPRVSLPFQTVETVNESAQERQRSLDFFAAERPADWRNRLIWGDKKYILPSLVDEFGGTVDLIYIDPPFDPTPLTGSTTSVSSLAHDGGPKEDEQSATSKAHTRADRAKAPRGRPSAR